MMLEDDATVSFLLDPAFPIQDVQTICERLENSGALIPGFVPPSVGFLALESLLYAKQIEGIETVILPDRNIVSRMARVAREGIVRPVDRPTQVALDVMALAQAMEIAIEPSIAFHELAHRNGNAEALEELRWFRAADHGQADAWVEVANGKAHKLAELVPGPMMDHDLAMPLKRWKRNYVVALRVAALELSSGSPVHRVTALIEWMLSDFFVAGPGAIFASMFLSPRASEVVSENWTGC